MAQSFLEDQDESEALNFKKLALIEQVNEKFDAQENLNDLAILYEITGFQDELPADDIDFWSNYANFKVLGATQMAINDVKVGE